ncbi:TetR/AcrR family transcriptional regulator [Seohaeicola saemankumensis]|nr:TetR/AcrR family transcriptional regulator [Seohaeicola saemankumensis]MCA0870335.1 TetR/AcrR family transcriptional regulator [Seohaeicola saemankumensis]
MARQYRRIDTAGVMPMDKAEPNEQMRAPEAQSNSKPSKKPRKRSKRAIETERRFLEAANEVFWAHGFSGSTISQVVEASGQSVGSFYHQFEDKADLLSRAASNVIKEVNPGLYALDLSRSANHDVFTLFYRLAKEGRQLVERHKGVYRALSERAQNNILGFGPLGAIAPTMAEKVNAVMEDYSDQLAKPPTEAQVNAASQLIATCSMQSGLGMGPMFPPDIEGFSHAISRAACGVISYTGQTDRPMVQKEQKT